MQRSLDRPSAIPWPPLLLLAIFLGSMLLGGLYPLSWTGVDDVAARIAGYAIGLAGVGLMLWSVATLYKHNTTVLPHKSSEALVTDGPFRYRRNPIYIADVLILLGIAELTKNLWFVVGAVIFVPMVTWLAILPEERHLEAKFGDAYRAYKERTRRWI